jgi:hypothetical protein
LNEVLLNKIETKEKFFLGSGQKKVKEFFMTRRVLAQKEEHSYHHTILNVTDG